MGRYFRGPIQPIRRPLLYRLSVTLVALAMVSLPVLYAALIAVSAWGVWWYATGVFPTAVVAALDSDFVTLAAAPIPAGIIAIVFLLKPFFGRRYRPPKPLTLARHQAPGLFRLVDELCEVIGAPAPARIDVDVRVNASAGLRNGLWSVFSNDLVLRVGLPLVDGLTLRQFTGVLAHEFGHFSQGAGMRLGFVIRVINAWFAEVVYGEDSWDRRLLHWFRTATASLVKFTTYLALECVWLSRLVLRLLMFVGRLLSTLLSRQMEFDADQAEARTVGSDTFMETSRLLHVLDVASASAHADLDVAWRSRQLSDDFPALIRANLRRITPEQVSTLLTRALRSTPTMYDAHPPTDVRIAHAVSPRWDGVCCGDGEARDLFEDFPALCQAASVHYYEQLLGPAFSRDQLVPAEHVTAKVAEKRALARANP